MNEERMLQVILRPHVSEKSAYAAEQGRFVFRVVADATKSEVSEAIEKLFKVEVTSVQVMNVKGKTKRFGQAMGKRSDWKKAYVRLAAGQDIDFTSIS